MKRILGLIVLLMLTLSSMCLANPPEDTRRFEFDLTPDMDKPTIAIVIADYGNIRSNAKAKQIINDKLASRFPKSKYVLVSNDDMMQKVYEYAEDEDINDPIKIKKSDMIKFGKKNNYDYVMFLIFRQSNVRSGYNIWSGLTYNVNVDLITKVADVNKDLYLFRKNFNQEGESTSPSSLGTPSTNNAWAEAVEKCMNDFIKDINISPIKPTNQNEV